MLLIAIFCIQSLVGSIGYLFFNLNWPVMIAIALASFSLLAIKKYWPQESIQATPTPKFIKWATALFLLLETGVIANLVLNQTTLPHPSPWQSLNLSFFFLFFASTALLLLTNWFHPGKRAVWLTSLHLLVMYSVTNIVYPLGFGFDGFTHRAAEEWIKTHGFIAPKQPIYIGQYVWVVFFSKLTTLPIKLVDIWLVPLLAAFTVPRIIPRALTAAFKITPKFSLNLIFVILFVYFFSLHLTTPFNVLILLTILGIFTTLEYTTTKNNILLGLTALMAAAGLFIHPLLGAPLVWFVLGAWLSAKYQPKQWFYAVYGIAMTAIVPVLFMAFLYFTRQIIPHFNNPFTKIHLFAQYWHWPFWYTTTTSYFWNLLYVWEWCIPLVVLILGIYGYTRSPKPRATIFLISSLALAISSFLLRSWVVFPDVHATEQGDYPLRLLKGALMFVLPWTMYGVWKLIEEFSALIATKKWYRPTILTSFFTVAAIITISWYLAYPQWNPKVHFPGYNVSAADYQAAEWIHHDNQEYKYLVLSNPITAVAALEKYSFAKYFKTSQGELSYYSIPTGGPLYTLYTEMWMEGQQRTTMEKAMAIAGVNKAYFVIPSYWTNYPNIVAGAKKSADSWQEFSNQKIYVFTYLKK